MIKNKLAIDVFKKFVEDNGRMPDYKEFKSLGYSTAHYYRVRKIYLEEEAKKAINNTLRNEMSKGKI